MKFRQHRLLLAFAFVSAPLCLTAQVVQTNFSTNDGSTPGFAVSSTDLLQTNLASVSGSGTYNSHCDDLSLLHNGEFNAGYGDSRTVVQPNVATLTFNFDLTTNTAGYSLTSIRTYASWGDSGRDGQDYVVYYSTVSAPTDFIQLVDVNRFDAVADDETPSTMIQLTDSGGMLATNVASLRFAFSGVENGGTGYSEFDVEGSASAIPEPSTYAAIVGAAMMGFTVWRRRAISSRI